MAQGDIAIYGAVRAMTGEGKAAYAGQVFDETQGRFQSAINQDLNRAVAGADEKSRTGNTNATSIEDKVNALIDCIQTLIQGVVFHSGTPFVSPEELNTSLELLRYTYSGTTPAICGQAICGQTICGTI
jgi:hypothetical protein